MRKRMKLDSINIDEVIENTKKILDEDPDVSPALKSSIQLLLLLVSLLISRLGLNSNNSSKPPSSDPNRKKKKKGPGNKKPEGQKGHDFPEGVSRPVRYGISVKANG